jgi:hypothetical protein
MKAGGFKYDLGEFFQQKERRKSWRAGKRQKASC